MDRDIDPAAWLAILLVQIASTKMLKKITGMTLDELDELNYARVMS